MSRRKQSIPCKVQGVKLNAAPLKSNSETSMDIVKLHTLTDALLNGGSKTLGDEISIKDKRSSHQFLGMKSYVETDESTLDHSKYPLGNEHTQRCGLDYSMARLNSSQLVWQDEVQSDHPTWSPTRLSAPPGDVEEGQCAKTLKFSETISFKDNATATTGKGPSLSNIELDNKLRSQGRERKRTISSEEELICPICHKGFMSKYGLLTHSEIHSTPELKCNPCGLKFTTRVGFVNHQTAVHPPTRASRSIALSTDTILQKSSPSSSTTKTYKAVSGFGDLSDIDFSCRNFPAISEGICSESLHRLTERDRNHFFLCKMCNYLYPTLSALQVHMAKSHESSSSSDNKNEHLEEIKAKANGIDASGDIFKARNISQKTNVSGRTTEFDLLKTPGILGLVRKDAKSAKVAEDNCKCLAVRYGMDDDKIRTSPMVACLEVPKWMRESDSADDVFDLFSVKTPKEAPDDRPPIKMKLVRRKGEERESVVAMVHSDYYIYDEPGTKESKEEAMDNFETKSSGGHKLGSVCGIGVRVSSNGRKMFWCRLCNYASFEKSTILRHQRTHTGVRPYTCRFCEIAFTTKANCERHIRKRHRSKVTTDLDIKNAVYCDYALMKKAREGDIDIPTTSKTHGNRHFNVEASFSFHFECRLCEATFSSRSNGARHVIAKHGIVGRKHANDIVKYVETSGVKERDSSKQNKRLSRPASCFETNMDESRNFLHRQQKIGLNSRPSNDGSAPQKMPRVTEVPKLIPLYKVKAYHEASRRMLTHFQRDYNEAVSLVSSSQDPEKFMSKIVSLLGSTSFEMKQDSMPEKKSHSVFTPIDILPSYPSALHSASILNRDVSSEGAGGDDNFMSVDRDKDDPYNGEIHEDVAQLFADGNFNGDHGATSDGPSHEDVQLQISPSDENSFKPWKNTSSSLMLRHFAANGQSHSNRDANKHGSKSPSESGSELSTVNELVKFAQKTSMMPVAEISNPPEEQSSLSISKSAPSSGSESRGKYQMVVAKTRPDQSHGDKDKPSLTWRFIPEPPRTRDEKGRYVRDPNSQSQHAKSHSSLMSFRRNDDRPTMVSMQGKKFRWNVNHRKSFAFTSAYHGLKGRKCPKCDKIFPWASSLSRHIMTHTGYKPYMCARCSMRFTTRSNLLRHAYRRHDLERGSEQRHDLLVTLSMAEQKQYADQEAQKIAEMDDASAAAALSMDMEGQNGIEEDEAMEDNDMDASKPDLEINNSLQDSVHYNKRYICGLCRLPFANRSNLVRHLHRLHDTTKDHPNFKELLIKIRKKVLPSDVNRPEEIHTPEENQERFNYSPPPTMVNGILSASPLQKTPTLSTSSSLLVTTPHKSKPFTCGICSIGFTKRNNCARHIQHQHNIDRKSARLRSLIIHNEANPEVVEPQKEAPASNEPEKEPVSSSPLPLDPEIPNEEPTQEDNLGVVERLALPLIEESMTKQEAEELDQEEEEKLSESRGDADDGSSSFSLKNRRRSSSRKKLEGEAGMISSSIDEDSKPRKKNIRLTQFVCGVCKRIYKTVEELKEHLDDHNIPHPWHCDICGVPFTNKYNCQRHLLRRHGPDSGEPRYVEDVRHGPRVPRKRPKTYG